MFGFDSFVVTPEYLKHVRAKMVEEDKILPYTAHYKGMEYTIKRLPSLETLAGYIRISPCFKSIASVLLMDSIHDIFHGGVTYKKKCGSDLVLGFDCGHGGDLVPGYETHTDYECLLSGQYRDFDYVKRICQQAIGLVVSFK